jgi:hypothetical protein
LKETLKLIYVRGLTLDSLFEEKNQNKKTKTSKKEREKKMCTCRSMGTCEGMLDMPVTI